MRLVLENRGVVSGIVAAGVWAASRSSLAPSPTSTTPSTPLIRRSASITYTSLNHKGEEAPKALATRNNLPAPNHVANTSPGKHQMVWNFISGRDSPKNSSSRSSHRTWRRARLEGLQKSHHHCLRGYDAGPTREQPAKRHEATRRVHRQRRKTYQRGLQADTS